MKKQFHKPISRRKWRLILKQIILQRAATRA